MVSQQEYDRYSAPLAQQMTRIALVGPRFLQALRAAKLFGGASPQLISDAEVLGQELGGRPGDGALEVYRDLDSNLQSARGFISRWHGASDSHAQHIIEVAREIQRELERMSELVSATPPHVMVEIKRRLSSAFGRGPSPLKMLLPILGPLAAIIGFQVFGVWGMIVVAWAALILYFIMK